MANCCAVLLLEAKREPFRFGAGVDSLAQVCVGGLLTTWKKPALRLLVPMDGRAEGPRRGRKGKPTAGQR